MACQKLSSLSPIFPDLPLHHHPRLSLLPFPPPQQDPLSLPHTFLFPCSPAASPTAPCVRRVFDDKTCTHPMVQQKQDAESACNSTESSVSSCFLSMNSDDDEEEDDTGSSSTSSLSSSNQSVAAPHVEGPLDNLASLCAALPIKRGLSRYFSGKSQSFSSLARVSSVADLAKPENPYAKRRRTGPGAESILKHHSYPPRSAGITKRRPTSNRHKTLRAAPCPELAASMEEDHELSPKMRPPKCFSVPEF